MRPAARFATAEQWLTGATVATPGVRLRGRNRARGLRWTRTCEVVTVHEPSELVWRAVPSCRFPESTEWCIRLVPQGQRTTITQPFAVVRAPWLLNRVYAWLIPAHQDRDARLRADLPRIGAVAAGRSVAT